LEYRRRTEIIIVVNSRLVDIACHPESTGGDSDDK
jgi:hypothetical protein